MEKQRTPEQEYSYFKYLARSLTKIDRYDPRVKDYLATHRPGIFRPYGGNFYYLFHALRPPSNSPAEWLYEPFRRTIESIGEPFQEFRSQNEHLIKQIDGELTGLDKAYELLRYYWELSNTGKADQTRELDKVTRHPLGVTAVVFRSEERMNPLLQNAEQKLRDSGIDPYK